MRAATPEAERAAAPWVGSAVVLPVADEDAAPDEGLTAPWRGCFERGSEGVETAAGSVESCLVPRIVESGRRRRGGGDVCEQLY